MIDRAIKEQGLLHAIEALNKEILALQKVMGIPALEIKEAEIEAISSPMEACLRRATAQVRSATASVHTVYLAVEGQRAKMERLRAIADAARKLIAHRRRAVSLHNDGRDTEGDEADNVEWMYYQALEAALDAGEGQIEALGGGNDVQVLLRSAELLPSVGGVDRAGPARSEKRWHIVALL